MTSRHQPRYTTNGEEVPSIWLILAAVILISVCIALTVYCNHLGATQ